MTRKRIRLVYLLLVLCKCAVSDIIDDVLNNEEPCAAVCDKTYSLITNVKHSTCCRRGCRFFTLMGVVLDSKEDLNATKDACQASCMEAYRHTKDRYACNIGCASMASIAQRRYQLGEEMVHKGLKDPAGVGGILKTEGANGKIVNLHHWAFHLIIRHRRPPSAPSLPPPQELFPSPGDPAYDVLTDPGLRPQLHYPLLSPQVRASLPHTHVRTLPGPLPAPLDDPLSPPSSPTSPDDDLPTSPWSRPWETDGEEADTSRDWFGCLASRAGMPRWFLPAVALCALVIAAWLCFAPDRVRFEYKKGQPTSESAKEEAKGIMDEEYAVKVPLLPAEDDEKSFPDLEIRVPYPL
ncbi:transmembrane protein 59-like [Hetaerina americana]|uniref:transmembrane protein 59-like n=1 Tax=Hetaerina americana TaxID=62018 RepID=UPI003A7F48F7